MKLPIEEYLVDSNKQIVIIAEHASNWIPKPYKNLGLTDEELKRHIAYDLGINHLSKFLAKKLSASLFLGTISRLVIDLNRSPQDPTLIREVYDGSLALGNVGISKDEKLNRLNKYFYPFHKHVKAHIEEIESNGIEPIIINIHSFARQLFVEKKHRPWHISVLAMDEKIKTNLYLSKKMHELLLLDMSKEKVGYNQPYAAHIDGTYSVSHHSFIRNLPYLILEVRQDLLESEASQEKMADYLGKKIITAIDRMRTE